MAPVTDIMWTIRIRHRIWVLTTQQLLWKSAAIAVCIGCVFFIFYAVYLVYTVKKSNQELAQIAVAENRYSEKNWSELERARQILLFAGETYTKRSGTQVDADDRNAAYAGPEQRVRRILREPYPIDVEVERLLGKANSRHRDGDSDHWVWCRAGWVMPEGWPSKNSADKAWTHSEKQILEAWFDRRGELTMLILMRQEPDGSEIFEHIGRAAGDWKTSRSESGGPQPSKSGGPAP
jgi:hypothetical protein